jgi:hypothetical protein
MAVVFSVVLFSMPSAAAAQARPTSFGGTHTRGALGALSFGVQVPKKVPSVPQPAPMKRPTPKDLATAFAALQGQRTAAQPPIDCKMVRPVDPTFHSAMPVEHPDRRVQLPSRILVVPSCQQETPTLSIGAPKGVRNTP